jgi:probable F420-dependent oxidoreductase
MQLGKLGVWSATDPLTVPELETLARRVESQGYGALWVPESRGHESFSLCAHLLARTERLVLATGIANLYARDPVTARQGQHTLAKLSGGRFLLGLGVSHIPAVEGLRGHTYGKPVPTMRAYLDAMDAATEAAPSLPEAPPLVLAALGPHMSRLAARRTRGLHPYNVTPEHTAWARALVGPEPWICVEKKVLLLDDPARARAAARQAMSHYLPLPNYRNAWLRLGFSEAELADGGNERFLDAMVAWGSADALRARVQAHLDAGATHVCIQTVRADGQRLPDFAALEALAPGT